MIATLSLAQGVAFTNEVSASVNSNYVESVYRFQSLQFLSRFSVLALPISSSNRFKFYYCRGYLPASGITFEKFGTLVTMGRPIPNNGFQGN